MEEVFFSIARDIKQRLADTDTKAEVSQPGIVELALIDDTKYAI